MKNCFRMLDLCISFLLIIFFSNIVTGSSVSLTENATWQANLTGVFHSSIALGDIDNDNNLDLIVMGCTAGDVDTCTTADNVRIYINNGNSLIENATWEQNLTSIGYGSLALGDIDNDGDLDLAITGDTGGGSGVVKIYVNDGTSLVENATWLQNLTNVDAYAGSLAFGDIDDDGDLDLALVGASPNSDNGIYINDGTTFTKNSTWIENFPYVGYGLGMGSLAFGDIDNDDDLDLIFLGSRQTNFYRGVYVNNGISLVENSTWESFNAIFAWPSLTFGNWNNDDYLDFACIGTRGGDHFYIFQNNGNTFMENTTESSGGSACTSGFFDGSLSWGDYDNNGDLDIVVIGKEAGRARVFEQGIENDWGCTFATDATAHADISDNIVQGSLAWGDIDNDGDLDLVITGDDDGTKIAKIYINNITTANTPPDPPTSFTASYKNNQLTLTWNNGSDAETPALGLYYNLRVGNTSYGQNIVSGVYGGGDDNGYLGNMMQRKSITLNLDLNANQTIYWSVQTIDTGLANGSWSAEQNYTLPLDITNPVITLNTPINYFNTTNPVITFNATVYDDINLTNVSLYGNWSGSLALNETNSSGINNTDYIFTKNLTSYGDGVYSWLIEAKDATNNTINSSTRQFRIDTTYPIISLITPSNASTWTSSNTVIFTYNVTDADIKNCSLIINNATDQDDGSITVNTAQTFTKTLDNGNYNWSINCTDYVNYKNNSETWQLTVSYTAPTSSSSSSGGGTSGGGGTSLAGPEDEALWFFAALTPKYHANMYINKPKIAFNKISFRANKQLKMVKLTVNRLEEENVTVKIKKKIYQYLRIKTENIEDGDLPNATIEFRVLNEWLVNNSINPDDISLFRLGNKWNELETEKTKDDMTYTYYNSITPGFSDFAISLKEAKEEKVENITREEIIEEVKEEKPVIEEKKYQSLVWFLIFGLIVICLICYFYVKKKR